jgi:hypothetical protein
VLPTFDRPAAYITSKSIGQPLCPIRRHRRLVGTQGHMREQDERPPVHRSGMDKVFVLEPELNRMRLRRAIFMAVFTAFFTLQIASQVSAQVRDLPFCRATTCAGAQQNCINARVRLNLSKAELQCERFGASCRRTLVFPGNPYSPFPQGCRVTGP